MTEILEDGILALDHELELLDELLGERVPLFIELPELVERGLGVMAVLQEDDGLADEEFGLAGLLEAVLDGGEETDGVVVAVEVVCDEVNQIGVGGDLVFELADVVKGLAVDIKECGGGIVEGVEGERVVFGGVGGHPRDHAACALREHRGEVLLGGGGVVV
ncbi:hypothetical protein J5N97_015304 [Dioscorea zingiberensis]|uniref:Uncharacterized protein n=1 Tax=Dioscorea zingiberensis TaxID=325984 RepID=A0A9D5HKC1_9LILI|nr:hypothetical protein J5N97_015304 [Dioscorea zingiberensis]